jgi:hypothetical protein
MNVRVRRGLLLAAIVIAQFFLFEAGLRTWGHSEAAPSFQALFMPDPLVGYRLRPNAKTRFVTSEFDTRIDVNAQGVRDDRDIGPKPANERRIVILGDSLVLSVQVNRAQTFCALLEDRLNRDGGPIHYRVINAGVQGYGPVEELLFFREVARAFSPDLVVEAIFVGNDAEEAVASAPRLAGGGRALADVASESLVSRVRRIVRRSMVLQVVRLRIISMTDRLSDWISPPAPPLPTYAAHPPSRIADGMRISADCVRRIAQEAGSAGARTMVMLIPARFQVDDADYMRLRQIVQGTGGELVRDAATQRFDAALSSLSIPRLDVLGPLRAALPGPDLFFQQTVHLTPRGHEIVAATLERFIRDNRLVDGL